MNNSDWDCRCQVYEDEDEDFIEIPHLDKYMKELEKNKRIAACKLRYTGMVEYMTIQDIDIWLKLKEEILKKQAQFEFEYYYKIEIEDYDYYYEQERDEREFRYLCFKDKYC